MVCFFLVFNTCAIYFHVWCEVWSQLSSPIFLANCPGAISEDFHPCPLSMIHLLFLIGCSIPLTCCSSLYRMCECVWLQVENQPSYALDSGSFFCICKSRMDSSWLWFGYLTMPRGTRLFSLCTHCLHRVCHLWVTRRLPSCQASFLLSEQEECSGEGGAGNIRRQGSPRNSQ